MVKFWGKSMQWEEVRVFDEIAGHPWTCEMPLSVLKDRLPLNCRYTHEVGWNRYIGMGIFGFIVFAVAFFLIFLAKIPILWQVLAALSLSPFGILFGYLKGYQMLMDTPVWQIRRLYKRVLPEGKAINEVANIKELPVDYEAMPIIVPIIHTKLKGVPADVAVEMRRNSAMIAAKQQTRNNGNGGTVTLTPLEEANLAAAYSPRIFRASSMYEILQARAVRIAMRSKKGKSDRLQKISMAGMALGSLGILVVVMLLFGSD